MDIKRHCHINSNEDGDRFVGIKYDGENAVVCFPLGYSLPESDNEIRIDIRNLIRVLSEFTERRESLPSLGKHAQPAEFPINAFRTVIEYFLDNNCKYYVETEQSYKAAASGKQEWARTAKRHRPLIQSRDGVSSFIFTEFEVRTSAPDNARLITRINRYCVYKAFESLGWLYAPFMPEEPGPHPDIKASIAIVRTRLAGTNDDKKRSLFRGMLDMLNYMDRVSSDKQFFFGTDDFEHVWEKLIDRAFGVRDKEKYFPRSRWLLDHGDHNEKRPLMPDTVMICNGKYYVLDAKYYKYGCTAIPSHLPNASSINKQITYGEYLEQHLGVSADNLFNAFIMPFDMARNKFGISGNIGNIGEAVGDWRGNIKYYERIQGIVIDTRYLMYHYSGNSAKEMLAECIGTVVDRDPVPPPPVSGA